MVNHLEVRWFRSIRIRILIFSILVTLLPSMAMGWFWFDLTRKVTTEKIEQKLLDSASFAEREINIWFQERGFDLRVFANSALVHEFLGQVRTESNIESREVKAQAPPSLHKIKSYLDLIREQYRDYRRLVVFDTDGRILASSETKDSNPDHPLKLPEDWKQQIEQFRLFRADAYSLAGEATSLMLIGMPVLAESNLDRIGLFAMEVKVPGIPALHGKKEVVAAPSDYAFSLFNKHGEVIVTAATSTKSPAAAASPTGLQELFRHPRKLLEFSNAKQERFVGLAFPLANLSWQLVVSKKYDEVFSDLARAGERIALITFLLTVVIGVLSTFIASRIIAPLRDLTAGVIKVANDDLDGKVRVHRPDELGIVSQMFNSMVERLKENQEKLALLATTDALTKLANRKQIINTLQHEMEQFRRYGTAFSILMVDLDHFKAINDQHGHLIGDAVLVRLARVFKESLRNLDYAGRYGGEEFLIILSQTELEQALQTAERIRDAVERIEFTSDLGPVKITLSIGVAHMKPDDLTSTSLIARADRALYAAKNAGRNRIEAEA